MEKFVMPEDHDNPAVFLHYTQKQLDWQYEHAQRFPDTSVFQKDRLERSEEARKKFKGLLDIPYDALDIPDCVLYIPDGVLDFLDLVFDVTDN